MTTPDLSSRRFVSPELWQNANICQGSKRRLNLLFPNGFWFSEAFAEKHIAPAFYIAEMQIAAWRIFPPRKARAFGRLTERWLDQPAIGASLPYTEARIKAARIFARLYNEAPQC